VRMFYPCKLGMRSLVLLIVVLAVRRCPPGLRARLIVLRACGIV